MGQSVSSLFDLLSYQISNSIRHDCLRYNQECSDCGERGQKAALELLKKIPSIRKILGADVTATFEGDPAARSYDEIILRGAENIVLKPGDTLVVPSETMVLLP